MSAAAALHHAGGFKAAFPSFSSKQDTGENFARRGHKGHQHGGTAHPLEIGEVEGKPGFEQDDDQGHLAQIGGDRKDRWIEQIERVRAEHNPDRQHPENPGNVQELTKGGGGQSGQENERERGEHGGSSLFWTAKKADNFCGTAQKSSACSAVPVSRGRSSFPVILSFMIVRFFRVVKGEGCFLHRSLL